MLDEIDSFIKVVILGAIDNFFEGEPVVDEYFAFLFEGLAGFAELWVDAWKEHCRLWMEYEEDVNYK